MTTWDDRTMLQKLQDPVQQQMAFRMLVEHFKEPLYWQIRRMVLSHDDADDILQNTFIKAWTGLPNFRGEAQISTWLFRIATNETLKFIERRKQLVSVDAEGAETIASRLQADPYFDGDETQQQLYAAISQLPEKQRQVFNMKYFDEMKYEEMSELLQTSVGALKASYHHAVKKISDYFHRLD
ncbi:MAG: sigma-70 family RNA polymerase sigma factor [Bacteroidaceae bacterium]|nr:sigma-70 family RNA polymerase sigma factor [Bacteroidaceae bacterium]